MDLNPSALSRSPGLKLSVSVLVLFSLGCGMGTQSLPDTTPTDRYFYDQAFAIAVATDGVYSDDPAWELGASGLTFDSNGQMTATWQGDHDVRTCSASLRGEELTLDCNGTSYTAKWEASGSRVISDVLGVLSGGEAPIVLVEMDAPFEDWVIRSAPPTQLEK